MLPSEVKQPEQDRKVLNKDLASNRSWRPSAESVEAELRDRPFFRD